MLNTSIFKNVIYLHIYLFIIHRDMRYTINAHTLLIVY